MDRLHVRDLMTGGVFAVRRDDDLRTVSDLMDDRRIRHAPVVDDQGGLIGLVTQRDLFRNALRGQSGLPPEVERAALTSLTAGEIMVRKVVTAGPDQDIRDAARVMLDNKFGCLPVVEAGRLVGIVTEADFVRLLAGGD
jgi:CBS domain-containing membrane protein